MPPTPIVSAVRYINPETTVVYFVPTIANIQAPLRAELDAGTDVTGEISEITGFTVTSNQVDTPDLKSRYTSSIPGRITSEDSSIIFYADREGASVQTLLPRNEEGFMVFLDQGDEETNVMDVYPVTVQSQGKPRSVEGSAAATISVAFSITSEPAENIPVPANAS